jgi:hypothetical protein
VTFAKSDCLPCPLRAKCTTAKSGRRQISLHAQEMHDALHQARDQQLTRNWCTDYALRTGLEGTIRQADAVTGIHHARYRGWPAPTSNASTPPPHST